MHEAEPSPVRHSLFDRLSAAVRRGLRHIRTRPAVRPAREPARAGEWRIAAGIAALIAAGPLATMLGAQLLADSARAEVAALRSQAAPRLAAAKAYARDRVELAALLRRPGVGTTFEALARALPDDAVLTRAGRGRDGALEAEVATPDPDKLRASLRREPALARLHDAGQRRGDQAMLVVLREPAP
jgi:hypothetical protein